MLRMRRKRGDRRSRWPFPAGAALITGASSGIGEGFARALARGGMSLLLVARPEDQERLCAVAGDLRTRHPIRVETIALDLTERDAPQHLQHMADELGFEPDLLVNCAGVGTFGPLADIPLEHQLRMVRLNVEAIVGLTGAYLPRMVARQNGAILNVASTAAFRPLPYHAVYCATKAFIVRFSEALWAETHRHGVRVIALCPGPVAGTHFSPFQYVTPIPMNPRLIPVEAVVQTGLRAVARDQPVATIRDTRDRTMYSVIEFVATAVPRRERLRAAERVLRRYFQLS
jgi:uncharacterized protein